jgi:putative FmdB family regulatory protein
METAGKKVGPNAVYCWFRPTSRGGSCSSPNVPTYEFRCPSGHDFERFFKTISTAPSQVECPECGAVAIRRLSGGGGLVFKGSGFYLTDYGKNAHRKAAPETKSDAKSDAKSDRGGDSSTSKADTAGKSESKAESKPKDTSKAENPSPKPSAKPKKE